MLEVDVRDALIPHGCIAPLTASPQLELTQEVRSPGWACIWNRGIQGQDFPRSPEPSVGLSVSEFQISRTHHDAYTVLISSYAWLVRFAPWCR